MGVLQVITFLALMLAGYPLARALKLEPGPRLLASAALSLALVPAATWFSGLYLPLPRPDLLAWGLAGTGGAMAYGDFKRGDRLAPFRTWAVPAAVVTVVALCQCATVYASGWHGDALRLTQFHANDGAFHLAIAGILRPGADFSVPWPPTLPVFAGVPLSNYHPFSDLWVTLLAPQDGHVDAYFRTLPLAYSLLFGATAHWALKEWGLPPGARTLGAALAVTCGSLGHLVHLFGPAGDAYWESHFWMSQPFSMLYNPPLALSLPMLMAGLAILPRRNERPWATALAMGVVWGLAYGAKAFLPLLMLPALLVNLAWPTEGGRRPLAMVFLAVAGFAALVGTTTTTPSPGSVVVDTLWPLRDMPGRLATMPLKNAALNTAWLMFLYFVGNLGLRVAGLPAMVKTLLPSGQPAQRTAVIACGGAFFIPLVFATAGVHWNTIQFAYYALAMAPLFVAAPLWAALNGGWVKGVAVGTVALGLALPTTIHTMWIAKDFGQEVPASEVTALRALRDATKPGTTVFVYPYLRPQGTSAVGYAPPPDAWNSAWVTAICARPSYVAAPMSLDMMRIDHRPRFGEAMGAWGQGQAGVAAWLAAHPGSVAYPSR